ncbi:TlpA family protein disulfide reductase [Nocardioides daejeonensis]|uniref:TlpA family protein disulfide reductase n=1 Tax=Nocardioides daejeonensis TaxID=1046556 RepID=UPI000D742FF2|nr:TlpA disulfide reductase family protein [Nocardioides daejeonensis]
MTSPASLAPELEVSEWIGTPQSLADLRGEVVLVETFQMLCPGCISHGLPMAKRVYETFRDVRVLGLHTVFEHHEVMGPAALRVFLSEYRIPFPVGVDRNDGEVVPVTMRTYGLQGTPSTLLIDRAGRLRLSAFGAVDDLLLGARLGMLLAEG